VAEVVSLATHRIREFRERTYHLERPNPPNPNLQPSLHPLHILQIDTLPPTPSRRLPPEKQQFLRHADGVAVGDAFAAFDVGAEAGESEAADDGFLGLAGTVAPAVIVVESAVFGLAWIFLLFDARKACDVQWGLGAFAVELTLLSTSQLDAAPWFHSLRSVSNLRICRLASTALSPQPSLLRSFPSGRFLLSVVWRKSLDLRVVRLSRLDLEACRGPYWWKGLLKARGFRMMGRASRMGWFGRLCGRTQACIGGIEDRTGVCC